MINKFKICTLVSLFLLSSNLLAGTVFVIANPGLKATQGDVKDIYLGEKQVVGGVKASPCDNKSIQADFISKALGVDKIKYDSVWAKKSFQDGLSLPKSKATDADVIDYVKETPGGIGYVSSPGSANVIGKF